MKFYRVGGSIRDELLGVPVQDTDWVVVGATPEAMVELGFRPVGADFPVFLHPTTHEEYALARTERKTAPGYKGFAFHYAPGVTLEQDLARRDLTINAMARGEDGVLVDPFGGRADLEARVLRHVSEAFVEDPVRVLRVARFAARLPEFSIAPETMSLLRRIVGAGEVDALVAERVWQEIARGLSSARPARMLTVLRECGALARLLPEVDALWHGSGGGSAGSPAVRTLHALDASARSDDPLETRYAVLLHAIGETADAAPAAPDAGGPSPDERAAGIVDTVSSRLRAPGPCRELARAFARERAVIAGLATLPPAEVVALVDRLDLVRRPARLRPLLRACTATGLDEPAHVARRGTATSMLRDALAAIRAVDAGAIAARQASAPAPAGAPPLAHRIAGAVRAAREAAVAALAEHPPAR